MAKPSSDGKSVTVEKGDTLSRIAQTYLGAASKYKQLAAINNISNPDFITIGQVIKLTNTGGSSPAPKRNVNYPIIRQFGIQSNTENTIFASWEWVKTNTASYKVVWMYDTGDGVWFNGSNTTVNVDDDAKSLARHSTYSIPSNAKRIALRVKPISKTFKKDDTETHYWEADWSPTKYYNVAEAPPTTPAVPTVTIDNYQLTAVLDNLDSTATHIKFEVVKNNAAKVFATSKNVAIITSHASYTCKIDPGGEYKVRCRAIRGSSVSEWSNYSSNVSTMPAAPSGITTIRAASKTSVYLEWSAAKTADSYDIEYATKKEYFDGSDQTTKKTGIESTQYEISGLESGTEYFFRVRSVNSKGNSAWTEPKSVVIGNDPIAPTTWSSTTTAITGEELILYWVHNTEDGSSQTYAELEMYVDGVKETHTIQNTTDEDEKDKTSSFIVNTSKYIEGTKILWRVRTAGTTKVLGDWSVQRTVDIYAPATLELTMTDADGNSMNVLDSFPFYIRGLAGPNTQRPIGYHLMITSNEIYETVDNMGNPKTVNAGEEVYSKYFDTNDSLLVEFSAHNIDLENNASYTATCVVSMDSGLTAESFLEFSVSWTEDRYIPNAEIGIDKDTFTAYIRPYCENAKLVYYKVNYSSGKYTRTSTVITSGIYGDVVRRATTTTGERVYAGTTADGEEIYYCEVEEKTAVKDVVMSVYRREFDGSFTELATNLDVSKNTTITDPHPALDFARYRIVATSTTTGAVNYYDPPGYPVNGKAVVIQWGEAWTSFETSEEAAMEQPPWSGSLLKLPYNIDVSDSHKPDVALIEYIGRSHPISYYGTHLGSTSTWNMEIERDDEETLYALRRLARWMGDVYVREPSGSGYWANVAVSFSQKHCELTIPVTLEITRVEGGA